MAGADLPAHEAGFKVGAVSGEARIGGYFLLVGGVLLWVLMLLGENLLLTGLIGMVVLFVLFALLSRHL